MSSEIKISLDASMLKSLVDNLGVSINVFNKKGKRIFVNPYYYYLSGRPQGSKFSSSLIEGENEIKAKHLTKKVMQAAKLGKTFEVHNFYYRSFSKKTRRYFDFTIGPLKNSQEEIIGAYSMVKDVTTRFLARKKLLNLNNALEKKVLERTEKLEKISAEKSMMVSDIAHEIKTILTIIRGNMEMLELEKRAAEPMEVECCKEIHGEMEKMSRIASDLVFIARSEEYAEMFKFEKFDVVALLSGLVKKYKIIAGERMKIINSSKFRKPLFITADKAKISVLVCNLIENAIKFSRKKSKLWISLQSVDSMAQIIFKDDGIGIEKEKINFIFSPFFQVSKTGSKKNERGFGLGLAICKKIVDAHKGEILVKSKGLNKGTTFEVLLPKNVKSKK